VVAATAPGHTPRQREVVVTQRLGRDQGLAPAETTGPSGEVVGHGAERQPGCVGGEATRWAYYAIEKARARRSVSSVVLSNLFSSFWGSRAPSPIELEELTVELAGRTPRLEGNMLTTDSVSDGPRRESVGS
jgi:hypothetical protein